MFLHRENNYVVYIFRYLVYMSTINKEYTTDQISKEYSFTIFLREFF